MPTEAITFDGQASGLEQLSGAPPLCANCLTDIAGTVRARPGIATWTGFPAAAPSVSGSAASPVLAMVPHGTDLYFATENRMIWKVDGAGSGTALSNLTTATLLDGTLRPQMLSLRTKVVTVGGGAPQSTDGTTLSFRLAGSPPNATTIAGIATRIVLARNDTSGIFQWSGLGDTGHSTWDALNFQEAEAKPDVLQAVSDNTNELFAFGSETLQVYSPDPVLGFAAGRALNIGLLAPYSLTRLDDQFVFLDRERRFVVTDGRGFSDNQSVISKPIEATLRALTTVDDCWGFRLRLNRYDACVFMFPTDGRGFIWDRRSNKWSEWRGWNAAGGYAAPIITSAVAWPENNLFLVGLSNGMIAKLDTATYTDLGTSIKTELLTGFIDHGTDAQKQNIAIYFAFKRGQTSQTLTAPIVNVSYRNDTGAWSKPTVFNLGVAGDYDPVLPLRSVGTYRRRQWKIEYTSDAEFAFMGAREEFLPLTL